MKNIIGLACDAGSCGHWRMIQPYRNLRNGRVHVDVSVGDVHPRWEHYDAVILQRPVKNVYDTFFKQFSDVGKQVIVEVDDLFPLDDPENPTFGLYKSGSPLTEELLRCVREADGVIVSTPYLQEHYKSYNSNVCLVRNSINFEDEAYKRPRKRVSDKVTMLWSGTSGHGSNLSVAKKAVEHCLSKHSNLVFALGGSPQLLDLFDVPKSKLIHIPECSFEEWKTLASVADFAIAPLKDNGYNRSKSNIRLLEPAVWSKPTIASGVGEYTDMASIVANTTEEWIDAIELYLSNAVIRKEHGKTAYNRTLSEYNLADANRARESFLYDTVR